MGWVAVIEKNNFLLFLQATKSGVAEAAPFCRAASLMRQTHRGVDVGSSKLCASLPDKEEYPVFHTCSKEICRSPEGLTPLCKASFIPLFPESQSEGGGQRMPRASLATSSQRVGVGLEFAVITPLVRWHRRREQNGPIIRVKIETHSHKVCGTWQYIGSWPFPTPGAAVAVLG